MSFNFNNSLIKSIKNICKLWYKYLIFLILYFTIILIFDFEHFSITRIINSIFFKLPNDDILLVVGGSFWFIYMFFIVTVLCNSIICIYNKYFKNLSNFKYIILISFLFYGISLFKQDFIFISTEILMYSFIYFLGYYLYNFKIKNLKCFLGISSIFIFLITCLYFFTDFNILNMQSYKFLYSFYYLLYSMISILIVFYLKDKINISSKNLVSYIGKNALIFYFCQGIGASMIYFILPHVSKFNILLTIILMFIFNFSITIISFILYKVLHLLINKIKVKISFIKEK